MNRFIGDYNLLNKNYTFKQRTMHFNIGCANQHKYQIQNLHIHDQKFPVPSFTYNLLLQLQKQGNYYPVPHTPYHPCTTNHADQSHAKHAAYLCAYAAQ